MSHRHQITIHSQKHGTWCGICKEWVSMPEEIESLRAEVDALKVRPRGIGDSDIIAALNERDQLREQVAQLKSKIALFDEFNSVLHDDNRNLREALQKYGRHLEGCRQISDNESRFLSQCDCGLADAQEGSM